MPEKTSFGKSKFDYIQPKKNIKKGGDDFKSEYRLLQKENEKKEIERKLNLIGATLKNSNFLKESSDFNKNSFETEISISDWFQIKILIDYQVKLMETQMEFHQNYDSSRLSILKGIQIFIDTNYNEIFFENRHKHSHFILLHVVTCILNERQAYKIHFYDKKRTIADVDQKFIDLMKPIDQMFRVTLQPKQSRVCSDLVFLSSLLLMQFIRSISESTTEIYTTNYGLTTNKKIHSNQADLFAAVGLDQTGLDLLNGFESTAKDTNKAYVTVQNIFKSLPVQDMDDTRIKNLLSNITANYHTKLKIFLDQILPEMLSVSSIKRQHETLMSAHDTEFDKWVNNPKVQNLYFMECEDTVLNCLFNNQQDKLIDLHQIVDLIDAKIQDSTNKEIVDLIQEKLSVDVQILKYLNSNSLQELKNSILLEQLELEEAEKERQALTIIDDLKKVDIPSEKLFEELPKEKRTLADKYFPNNIYETAGSRIDENALNRESTQKHLQRVNSLVEQVYSIYSSKDNQSEGGLTETLILLAKNPAALGYSAVIPPKMVEYFTEGNARTNIPPGSIEIRIGRKDRLFLYEKDGKFVVVFLGNPPYHGGQTTR